jgi:diguanylate cyclase (GGDEF)-like protein
MRSHTSRFLFGDVTFGEGQEYLSFQYRFLIVVLIAGALATAVFLLGESTRLNRIDSPHVVSMAVFTTASLLLWGVLRGRPCAVRPVAWIYLGICQLEYLSALMHVPQDEMRALWFLTNVPGVYLLLGRRAGAVVTALTVVGLAWINPRLSAPYSPNGLATLLVGIVYQAIFFHVYSARSISYLQQVHGLNRQLHDLADRDALTGLLNARAYYAGCEQALAAATREGHPSTVLFVDLDHFKRINDTRGHAAGDEVLRRVAACLIEQVRHSDWIGRIGGEEFSLLLPRTSTEQALPLAERLRARLEALQIEIDGQSIPVTASIGVATAQAGEHTMATLQQQVDGAMYQAKARGRNRVSMLEVKPETSALVRPDGQGSVAAVLAPHG